MCILLQVQPMRENQRTYSVSEEAAEFEVAELISISQDKKSDC